MSDSTNQSNARQNQLDELLAQLMQAIDSQETVRTDDWIERYPEFAAELREFFGQHQRVEQLVRPLRHAAEQVLHVRCPHCHNPIELVEEAPLRAVNCPSCGSNFSLVGHESQTLLYDRGKTIAQFELLEHVGMGQFGSVWKARDTQLDRLVAVKIPRQGQLDEAQTALFLRDARAAAQLNHPHIVSVHEVGTHEGTLYIVSDFVQGATLQEWMDAKRLTTRETAELCVKLADALQHAHKAGVIHRDLKPSNIMLDAAGEPHIVDFGLAKRDAGEITMTVEGQILGTPAYMSPEQARGEGHTVDCRADLYSLGVILFQLSTGELPFRGEKQMLIVQIQQDDPPAPRTLNKSVPRELETICLKCLEKEPASRFASAAELQDELQRHLQGEPIHSRPITSAGRVWRWCRRNPVVASLTAFTTTLLLILGIAGPIAAIRQNRLTDDLQRQLAMSSAVRLARESLRLSEESPVLSTLLALEAVEQTRRRGEPVVPEAFEALVNATALEIPETGTDSQCSISPDGHWLVTRAFDEPVSPQIWALAALNDDPQPLFELTLSNDVKLEQVWGLTFSADHRRVFGVADDWKPRPNKPGDEHPEVNRLIHVWDLNAEAPGTPLFTLPVDGQSVVFCGELQLAFVRDWGPDRDHTVRIIDLSGSEPRQLGEPVTAESFDTVMSVSPNGHWLVTGSPVYADIWGIPSGTLSQVQLWDLTRQMPTPIWHSDDVVYGGFVSHDCSLLAASQAGSAVIFDLSTDGEFPAIRELPIEDQQIRALSPEGRWLLTSHLKLAREGRYLESNHPPAVSELWDLSVETPQPIRLPGVDVEVQAVALHNQWLVTQGADRVHLWDLAADDILASRRVLPLHEPLRGAGATFSPDGRWVAMETGDDFTSLLTIWDLSAPKSSWRPWEIRDGGGEVIFLTDGKLLAGKLYDLEIPSLLNRAGRLAGRELTAEERQKHLVEETASD